MEANGVHVWESTNLTERNCGKSIRNTLGRILIKSSSTSSLNDNEIFFKILSC
jgi:hypothetical protein